MIGYCTCGPCVRGEPCLGAQTHKVRPAQAPCSPLRFTREESEFANRVWKATCGPHSIAAACGLSLDEVREQLDYFGDYKGWMSPTQVERVLLRLKKPFRLTVGLKTMDLCNGINRIQWEGEWLNPGVPARVAYRHTHWVAHFDGWVLCTACLTAEWIPATAWRRFHLEDDPPSPFHITHHYAMAND